MYLDGMIKDYYDLDEEWTGMFWMIHYCYMTWMRDVLGLYFMFLWPGWGMFWMINCIIRPGWVMYQDVWDDRGRQGPGSLSCRCTALSCLDTKRSFRKILLLPVGLGRISGMCRIIRYPARKSRTIRYIRQSMPDYPAGIWQADPARPHFFKNSCFNFVRITSYTGRL